MPFVDEIDVGAGYTTEGHPMTIVRIHERFMRRSSDDGEKFVFALTARNARYLARCLDEAADEAEADLASEGEPS